MSKFKFIHEHSTQNSTFLYEFEEISLGEILENFEYFLKGCGFHFDGQLEITYDEDANN